MTGTPGRQSKSGKAARAAPSRPPNIFFATGSSLASSRVRTNRNFYAVIGAHVRHLNKWRSEEHTSELQSRLHLVCRLLLEKKKRQNKRNATRHVQQRSNPL